MNSVLFTFLYTADSNVGDVTTREGYSVILNTFDPVPSSQLNITLQQPVTLQCDISSRASITLQVITGEQIMF